MIVTSAKCPPNSALTPEGDLQLARHGYEVSKKLKSFDARYHVSYHSDSIITTVNEERMFRLKKWKQVFYFKTFQVPKHYTSKYIDTFIKLYL